MSALNEELIFWKKILAEKKNRHDRLRTEEKELENRLNSLCMQSKSLCQEEFSEKNKESPVYVERIEGVLNEQENLSNEVLEYIKTLKSTKEEKMKYFGNETNKIYNNFYQKLLKESKNELHDITNKEEKLLKQTNILQDKIDKIVKQNLQYVENTEKNIQEFEGIKMALIDVQELQNEEGKRMFKILHEKRLKVKTSEDALKVQNYRIEKLQMKCKEINKLLDIGLPKQK